MVKLKEKIEDHKNSIELSLFNFLEKLLNLNTNLINFNESEKKFFSSLITKNLPFNDYIQLSLLLDYDENKIPKNKILQLLQKNIHYIESEFKENYNEKFNKIKDKVEFILLKLFPNSKEFNSKEVTENNKKLSNYELAKLSKPRGSTIGLPKYGAFDKDTKNKIKLKNPYDRRTIKHKGKDKMNNLDEKILEEGILGVTAMPSLMRMKSLAGIDTTSLKNEESVEEKNKTYPLSKLDNTPEYIEILSLLEKIDSLMPNIKLSEFEELKERFEELLKD